MRQVHLYLSHKWEIDIISAAILDMGNNSRYHQLLMYMNLYSVYSAHGNEVCPVHFKMTSPVLVL